MIGINSEERAYIKYKPSLTYQTKILSTVTSGEEYTPSPVIHNLLKLKPSGLLGEIDEELDVNRMMQQRLAKCLEDTNVNGITVDEYLKNAKSPDGDKELVRKFDHDNALAVNGTSQAECLPLLLEMEKELLHLSESVNSNFYNNEANLEHLEYAEEKDDAKLDALVQKDKSGPLDRGTISDLTTDNLLLEICRRRLNNCKKMSKEVNALLCTTVNTYYNGNVDDVVHKFGTVEVSTLEAINQVNLIEFRKSTNLCEQDKLRNSKLNAPEIKQDIQQLFLRIGELKKSANAILDFALSIDTDMDQNPLTQVVSDSLDQYEAIQMEFEKATLEIFKQIKLDEMVKNDIVTSLQEKRTQRQKVALLSSIIEDKKSGTFNAENFIESNGLRKPGTMCSR